MELLADPRFGDIISDEALIQLKARGYKIVSVSSIEESKETPASPALIKSVSETKDDKAESFIEELTLRLSSKGDIPLDELETAFKQRGDRWDGSPELYRLLGLRIVSC